MISINSINSYYNKISIGQLLDLGATHYNEYVTKISNNLYKNVDFNNKNLAIKHQNNKAEYLNTLT